MNSVEIGNAILTIKQLASYVISKKQTEYLYKIHSILTKDESASKYIVQMAKIELIATFVMTVRNSDDEKNKMNEDTKIHLLKILSTTLSHNELHHNEMLLFLNIYGCLIQEVYDLETAILRNTSEELTWEVLNCAKILFKAATDKLCLSLHTRENAFRLCKILYIVGELLKSKCRKLKSEAIKCLMSMFRVNSKHKIDDFVCNNPVARTLADCYSYCLPGIASSLGGVIFEGDIVGGNILKLTIEAVGKIMTILLKDYEEKENSLEDAKAMIMNRLNSSVESKQETSTNKKEEYLKMQRTWKWFQKSDKHLALIFEKFNYLTDRSNEIRLKLIEMCISLIKHCFKNIPQSAHPLTEMLVIMSEDKEDIISKELFDLPVLGEQIKKIISGDFYRTFSRIPTIFNGIDTVQQVNILKLTSASLKFVGSKIKCNESFKEFQRTLLYLCEVEIGTSNMVEVVSQQEFDGDSLVPVDLWTRFKFMREEKVRLQFEELCRVIFEVDLFPVLSDYLIDIITFGDEKIEAFYLMNRLLEGINKGKLLPDNSIMDLVMPTFETYINNWNIPLKITTDDDECITLKTLKTNILQAALMCEGVGLMANHAKGEDHLRPFLFDSMYKVLIRAASGHYLIRMAATKALKDMASGLGFSDVSGMLNENMDFFLFYVERGLKRNDHDGQVFEVMEMVMRYGDSTILQRFSDWVNEVLILSFDKFKQDRIDSYLRVFRVFLGRLMKWYKVDVPELRVFKSLKEKKEAEDCFKVNGVDQTEITDFSDEIMGKTAHEMFLEDMEKNSKEDEYVEPEDEPYQKPTAPIPIKITVEILKRSLNYLPSKDKERKLLVLEILRNGIEIIKDHEDELLPVVHLIWSPLVDRFKDVDSPVILNFSFQLLVTMARVSKDFIRHRTSKDVLPGLLSILTTLSKNNHKESSKYSLDYKLQLTILNNMFGLIYDTELLEEDVNAIMNVVILYTSINQPSSLRIAAHGFLKQLSEYDPAYKNKAINVLGEDLKTNRGEKCEDVKRNE